MKNNRLRAAVFAAALVIVTAVSPLFSRASALTDSGFTHLITTGNPECYADIVIAGDHFSVEGRAVKDPVIEVRMSTRDAIISGYEFTAEDSSFSAEFDCSFSGGYCYLWLVQKSGLVMNYLIQHDEKGWSFPDNGLAVLNAEKLENIQTAAPMASAYYLSQTADPDEIGETLEELEQIVQEVCGDEKEDYKKAYLIYRWVSENIYYDKDAAATGVTLDTVAVHNVLERRRTTCAGYSNTYCAMLEIAGIRSVNLKGAAVAGDVTYATLLTGGENHEFTAFWYEAENRWVYVDPTWGSSGRYEYGEYRCDYPSVDRYFDVTGEAFALNHRADKAEERSYTDALSEVSGEENEVTGDGTDTDTDVSQSTEESDTQTSHTTVTTAPPKKEPQPTVNYVIYAVIGAVGVVTVIIGITLVIKNKTR